MVYPGEHELYSNERFVLGRLVNGDELSGDSND